MKKAKAIFKLDHLGIDEVTSKLLINEKYACYMAFNGTEAVGLITICHGFAIYNGGDFGVITELYVVPERRSHGIGQLLLQKAHEFAVQQNWNKTRGRCAYSKRLAKDNKFL